MQNKKIIAYFMHESEENLLSSILSNPKKTQSYFIGEVNDEQYNELQSQKIVMQVLNNQPTPESKERGTLKKLSRIKGFNNIHTPALVEILEEQQFAGFPAYYRFLTDGPLLEEYKTRLNAFGIEILEFIPPNSYLVRLNSEDDYVNLKGLLFINAVEFYSSKDTGIHMLNRNLPPPRPGNEEKQILPFDIWLHREEDMPEVLNWLNERRIAIAGSASRKIRIYLLEDSPLKTAISEHTAVQSLDEYMPPKLHNDIASSIIGINSFTPSLNPSITYTGDGQVVGVADTGIDDTHPDFQNRIHNTPTAWGRLNDYSDFDGHGSHVAGSIVGNGTASNGSIKGMAPGAKVFFQSIMDAVGDIHLPLQLSSLFQEAYNNGARIHNNSWGSATGSRYTVNAIEVDEFVAQNRDMLLVFSAGNEGNAFRPINSPIGFPDLLSIGSPGSAKNILTVGASRSGRTSGGYSSFTYSTIWPNTFPNPPLSNETVSGDSNSLAGFSSRGPCDDNRVKPDVVAPGTDIASVKSTQAPLSNYWGILPGNKMYAIMGGTSMAAPIVAGCAAIVREYYQKIHTHNASAALVKATIINGCKKLTGADSVVKFPDLPNYNQGFGMVDMPRTIPHANNNFFLKYHDNYDQPAEHIRITGQRTRLRIQVTTDSWLRICLAYTDVPGRALQNNLNIMLGYDADNTKWIGNENVPSLLKMPDATNNVEVIIIDKAKAGNYTLQIAATNIIKGPQDFSYVITCGDINTTTSKFH